MISPKWLICALVLSCAATIVQADVLAIATNPQGSSGYSAGAAIATVMQQKGNLTARVLPMSGSSTLVPLMNSGKVEFGFMNPVEQVNAYNGVGDFNGRKNSDLRVLGVMWPLALAIGVPNDSPVKSLKDLKGLRMPTDFTSQKTMVMLQDAILASAGLSAADMKPYPVSNYVKGMQALAEGKVDAAIFGPGTAGAQEANASLASHGGLRFLPMIDTPEGLAGLHSVFPNAYSKLFQPSPGSPGIIGPTQFMVYSIFLMTNSHVPNDVVYAATKAIYENKPLLQAITAIMKEFEPNMMAEAATIPYHPGAEKFYKEIGQWPPKKR